MAPAAQHMQAACAFAQSSVLPEPSLQAAAPLALKLLGALLAVAGRLAQGDETGGAPAPAGGGAPSPYWGTAGEDWSPDGPLNDFSYAGETLAKGVITCRAWPAVPCSRACTHGTLPPLCAAARFPAGYRSSDAELPNPPATGGRSLSEFQTEGRSDTDAMAAMVDWANQQPSSAGWIVLSLPAGRLTLDRPVKITRSQTVLRGAGMLNTTIYLPYSLTDVFGKRQLYA